MQLITDVPLSLPTTARRMVEKLVQYQCRTCGYWASITGEFLVGSRHTWKQLEATERQERQATDAYALVVRANNALVKRQQRIMVCLPGGARA